jgi:hypothetical protein
MSSVPPPSARIVVPGQRSALAPPDPARVRALKRHLIESIRDLARAKRPERLIQKRGPEPDGAAARLVADACAHCRGACCMAGGTTAFVDDRTMARLARERPDLTAHAAVAAYVRQVAPLSYAGSCLFHGSRGCTLDRSMRAELCNAYYCSPLEDGLRDPVSVREIATHDGEVAARPL